jgi:hypothetical protein
MRSMLASPLARLPATDAQTIVFLIRIVAISDCSFTMISAGGNGHKGDHRKRRRIRTRILRAGFMSTGLMRPFEELSAIGSPHL